MITNNTLRTRSSNGFTYRTIDSDGAMALQEVFKGENRNIFHATPFKWHVVEGDVRTIFDTESEAVQYFEDKLNYGIDSVGFLSQHKPKGGVRDTAESLQKKQGLGWQGSNSLKASGAAEHSRKIVAALAAATAVQE